MTLADFKEGMGSLTGWPETYAYYIARKVTDTLGIFAALVFLVHVHTVQAAWAVWCLYVGWGLWSWYRGAVKRPLTFSGRPGTFLGDLVYHGWISGIVFVLVYLGQWPAPIRLAAVVLWALGWFLLYMAGYGLMRNPGAP